MLRRSSGVIPDLAPNSKPYLLKRIIADGFDTVTVFLLFFVLSALIFASPLAGVYNGHYENYKQIEKEAVEEYNNDAAAITEALNGNAYYNEVRFAARLHAYILQLLAGFTAELALLLLVPLVSKRRQTFGKMLTGVVPFCERKQTKASRIQIFSRFMFVFILDSALLYLVTGIFTFLLVPVIRLTEMLLNKNNKTVCDAVTGVMNIEQLSYNGIDNI